VTKRYQQIIAESSAGFPQSSFRSGIRMVSKNLAISKNWSGRRVSNSRPTAWEAVALELFRVFRIVVKHTISLTSHAILGIMDSLIFFHIYRIFLFKGAPKGPRLFASFRPAAWCISTRNRPDSRPEVDLTADQMANRIPGPFFERGAAWQSLTGFVTIALMFTHSVRDTFRKLSKDGTCWQAIFAN